MKSERERTLTYFLFAVCVFASPAFAEEPPSATKEQRVALVIGNGAYKSDPLRNPVNDAEDIAHVLRGLGFRVTLKKDASQRDMISAINSFGQDLKKGGVGLFYFAGHGVQSRGRNFLVPVNAHVESEAELEFEAVDANRVLSLMDEADNRVNIVILDACRNNPFARSFRSISRGLAQLEASRGSFIAFSTAPGSVASDGMGRNGIYTQHLLSSLKNPNSDIDKVFRRVTAEVSRATSGKQVPWVSSSLTGDFSFRPDPISSLPSAAVAVPLDPTVNDRAFWESVKDSKNPEELTAYLEQFPNGLFAALAHSRLKARQSAELESTASPTVSISKPEGPRYESIVLSDAKGGEQKNVFNPQTAKVFLHAKLVDVPSGSKVKSDWIAEKTRVASPNYKMDSVELKIGPLINNVDFNMSKPTKGWPPGDYRVDLFIDDKPAGQVRYQIVK